MSCRMPRINARSMRMLEPIFGGKKSTSRLCQRSHHEGKAGTVARADPLDAAAMIPLHGAIARDGGGGGAGSGGGGDATAAGKRPGSRRRGARRAPPYGHEVAVSVPRTVEVPPVTLEAPLGLVHLPAFSPLVVAPLTQPLTPARGPVRLPIAPGLRRQAKAPLAQHGRQVAETQLRAGTPPDHQAADRRQIWPPMASRPSPCVERCLTVAAADARRAPFGTSGAFGGGRRRTRGTSPGASSARGCQSPPSGMSNQAGAHADRTQKDLTPLAFSAKLRAAWSRQSWSSMTSRG
jgi:hypothetical protein